MESLTFAQLDLPAPLAEAIAARGYERPTAVQAAVAGPENAGRDLLVSSETGSGKTLAFGIALGEGVLDGSPAHGKARALVITPTRELATQVRGELAWLYGKTKLRFAVFTGGTDVRGDLVKLRHGVDLVVGTPGRLVDLVTRGSLALDAVRTVVLDEADEMLDMGFREDLETLLAACAKAAPEGARARTLLFSATLPQEIIAMAARYQHDAVRVDARTHKGASGTHADITYVAHLVAMGEKLPAVVNVLRNQPGVRAIVFGTTRDGVADLHQQLVNKGFRAVVLSGDRAQSERTRSLAALKDGEADILVATNVAARGLDLPEVDLVLHADLPLNTEALTHRSGRTGRAGRKGTSVLIATLAERRKAERLLGNARVPFTWTAAPSAEDLQRTAESGLAETLLEAARGDGAPAARALAARLTETADKDALLAALLARELERLPSGERLSPVDLQAAKRSPAKGPTGPRPVSRGDFSRAAVMFRVNIGRNQKAEPGWLLPLICRRGGITRHEVGSIRVGPLASDFEIAGDAAEDFALASSQPDPRAPHVRIQRLGDAPPAKHAPRDREAHHAPRDREAHHAPRDRDHQARADHATRPRTPYGSKPDLRGGPTPPHGRRPPPGPRKAGTRRPPPRHR
jgi:ATP-dependent RNA helicase DeaD